MKRFIALIAAAAGLATMLTSCEVTQIDWRNHFYAVGQQSCLENGSATVKNGTGVTNGGDPFDTIRIDVVKTVYGDVTRDGIQDAAVLLRCTRTAAPHIAAEVGYEIQVFTRDGKAVGRISPPQSANASGSYKVQFVPTQISYQATDEWGGHHLTTGVSSWDLHDPQCCPSIHQTYIWTWVPGLHAFEGAEPVHNGA